MLQEVYGDFLHHNDRAHLDGGITDDAVCQRRWRRLDAQSEIWYAKPSGVARRRFAKILATEWRGFLDRSWKSERPLIFAHVILMKTLGVRRAQEIRAWITRRMDLWERGLHAGLVGEAEAERATREGRAASGGEKGDEAVARSFHKTVISGKLRQAVCWATDREGGGVSSQTTNAQKPGDRL